MMKLSFECQVPSLLLKIDEIYEGKNHCLDAGTSLN